MNLSPTQLACFDRVRGMIKGSDRESRTEAFLRYLEDHPDEQIEAIDRVADLELRSLIRPMLDFYETPAWAIRALGQVLYPKSGARILDPGCGTGAILRTIGAMWPDARFVGLEKNDHRYEAAAASTDLPVLLGDFLTCRDRYDVIVSNPPYSHALEFVQHALTLAPVVCMLLRLPWLASQKRAEWHRDHPSHVCVLPKRPSFTGDGKTDATEYAWFVWGTADAGRWTILTIDAKAVRREEIEDRKRGIARGADLGREDLDLPMFAEDLIG